MLLVLLNNLEVFHIMLFADQPSLIPLTVFKDFSVGIGLFIISHKSFVVAPYFIEYSTSRILLILLVLKLLVNKASTSSHTSTMHLFMPAYIQSIPAAADQEDFVSMGMNSALKTRQILDVPVAYSASS